jgi:uncharacterized membrane protein YhhN
MKEYLLRPTILISTVYLLLALLHFSPVAIAYKLAFPLAFLTLCALRYTSWPMVLAMGFSALGDYMGVCHNFWGQMGAFALAHAAYILFFCRTNPAERTSDGMKWKSGIVILYGVVIGMFVLPHVHGLLQAGVSVYILLILSMCILAWRQKNPYYAHGAWLFVLSDTVLAWNKFVSHIEGAGYLIMIPYYLGQWMLFIQSFKSSKSA